MQQPQNPRSRCFDWFIPSFEVCTCFFDFGRGRGVPRPSFVQTPELCSLAKPMPVDLFPDVAAPPFQYCRPEGSQIDPEALVRVYFSRNVWPHFSAGIRSSSSLELSITGSTRYSHVQDPLFSQTNVSSQTKLVSRPSRPTAFSSLATSRLPQPTDAAGAPNLSATKHTSRQSICRQSLEGNQRRRDSGPFPSPLRGA